MADDPQLLRHMIAVIAYRGGKVLRDAPAELGATRVRHDTRSAVETLAHINDVLEWGLATARGTSFDDGVPMGDWTREVDRFFAVLAGLDEALNTTDELPCSPQRLLAGPLADALTHIGQLATLRKLAGAPVRGEGYYVAEVETGRVGRDQAAAKREFD